MSTSCDQCRIAIGADPDNVDAITQEHLAHCNECADYFQRTQKIDSLFKQALHKESEVLVTPAAKNRHWQSSWPAAMAAGLAIITVSVLFLWTTNRPSPLTRELVHHLVEEPAAFSKAPGAADPAEIQRILASANIRLRADSGAVINYIMRCDFNGQKIVHMVVESENGPVTILLMTEDRSIAQITRFSAEGYHGLVKPAARGAVAVLSSDNKVDLDSDRLLQAFEYQTG